MNDNQTSACQHSPTGSWRSLSRSVKACAAGIIACILVCLLLVACAGPKARPVDQVPFRERAKVQSYGGLQVTVAVPTIAESAELYGVELAGKDIQPVWLEIRNDTQAPYWLITAGMDPEFYTPSEAAFAFQSSFSKSGRKSNQRHFKDLEFDNPVLPGATHSGFVLVNLDEGVKAVDVDLVSREDLKSFSYIIEDPDFRHDMSLVEFESLYDESQIVDYTDLEQLRPALESLPCCTTNKKSEAQGDPLNLVLIGNIDDIFPAFVRRGWHPTEMTWSGAIWRTIKSFLATQRYRYSPVSPLYVFGRPQDLAGQKARGTIHERNHLRLWLTPMRFRGKGVWVGQISRDIGVKFTLKSPTISTHKIDPDVDEARAYLIEDLAYSQALALVGWVSGVEPAGKAEPRENLTGDPYYTDGLRAVMVFDRRPRTLADVDILTGWELPLDLGLAQSKDDVGASQ